MPDNETPGEQVTPETPAEETKPEQTPEETKPTEGQKEEPKPISYDLKLPDNALVDKTHVDEVVTFAKEYKLTNDVAQKILERSNQTLAAYVGKQKETFETQSKTWADEVKNDKELGGEKFNETVETAKRVLDKFGSDDFKKALNETGLGNHPELVRVFARIGKTMSEDKLVLPGTQGPGKKSMEEVFYGGSEPK
jgi:hypothetical protein